MRVRPALVIGCLFFLAAVPAVSDETKTLKGQVVCGGCWDEASDRHKEPYGTEDDLKCAARCERKGVAPALAVDLGKDFAVYDLERGAFHQEGGTWQTYMGKNVEVTGHLSHKRGASKRPRFVVDALKVVPR